MEDKRTDSELIDCFKSGDKLAFDVLVLRYQFRINRIVNRYVQDQAESLDITQEAFIKAFRCLDSFRNESSFYTWIYRIAVNTAKNHLVANGRKLPEYDYDAKDVEELSRHDNQDYTGPERFLISGEIKALFDEEVDKLPIELRTALQLRDVDGLTYDQIASVMSCPVGTVRSRIYRAREVIGSKFGPLYKDF